MLRAERITPATVAPASPPPGPPPLTHHEILGLAEPFSRAGRNVDLAASDRLARLLAFRPRAHGAVADMPAVREGLQLDAADSGWLSLQRSLSAVAGADVADAWMAASPSLAPASASSSATASSPTFASVSTSVIAEAGLQASLQAEGATPAQLLAWVDAVPPQRQWQQAAGVRIALSHKLQPAPRGQTEPVLTLLQASARLAGLAVVMKVSRVKNVPAELELRPLSATAGPLGAGLAAVQPAPAALPEDLLSVLGLDWSRLSRHSAGWRASLRLRGEGLARALDAEAKFRRSIEHLVRVLGAAPAAFHDHYRAARWRVSLRRGFPLLVCLLLIAASAAVPLLELGPGSVYRMLIFNAPPLLMVWLFAMRELPRIELPPLPRPLPAGAWVPSRPLPAGAWVPARALPPHAGAAQTAAAAAPMPVAAGQDRP